MADIKASFTQNIDATVNIDGALKQELEATKARAEQLDANLKRARHTVEQLSNELNNLKTTRGIIELENQLDEFRNTASRSLDEFKDFLKTVQLQEFANVGEGFYRFREWFNNISEGAQTASEAIAEVKAEYSELIMSGSGNSSGTIDSQMLRTFTSTLQSVASSIDEVRAKLTEFQENGIRAIPTIQGSDNTISGLEQVKNTIKEMADSANGAYEPLTKLIGVMTDYANIDNTNLFSVSQAIAGLGEIGKGSYSVKSVENTINLLTRLQTLTRAGAIHFNVTGLEAFSNLSVRKASLNNLATFLPTIASVDVANLERLSHVDLSNFNNLDIKKASMNNLVQMIEAVNNMRVDTSWSADLIQAVRDVSESVNNSKVDISWSNELMQLARNISNSIAQLNESMGHDRTIDLNIDKSSLQGLETILNDINNVIQHTDIPKVSGEMSEMGGVAQRVATYLGRYRDALNDAENTKVHNSLTDLGIAAKDADVISQHLSDMHIKVKSITPEWETITKIIDEEIIKEQKLKQITVQGTTALGDAVNHVIKFNAETGDISKEITRATVKGNELKQTIKELADGTKETNIETTVANLKEIDGLIKSIEKTNSSLNSSKNKVTDLLGGLSTTGKNREELDAINKKFDELTVATERLKTNRMTANQEDIDGLRKVQEELDALIRKSQERLRIEAESKGFSSATSAEKNVSRIKEMLNTKDIDASVAKVTYRFEKLGNSGAQGLDRIRAHIVSINKLLALLKSPQVLSDDNALLSTYQRLDTLLETVSNKISIIESRTNTSKKINFGIDTEKFKTDVDVLVEQYQNLTNKSSDLYHTVSKNIKDLQAAFGRIKDTTSTQEQRVAAYQQLEALIPVVTKQLRVLINEESEATRVAKDMQKIKFGMDTKQFQIDINLIRQAYDKLENVPNVLRDNFKKLNDEFARVKDVSLPEKERIAAYNQMIPLLAEVRRQLKLTTNIESVGNRNQFARDTDSFKTSVDAIERDFHRLQNTSAESYQIIQGNVERLKQALHTLYYDTDATYDDEVGAYQKLESLLPIVTRQIREQAKEEKIATDETKQREQSLKTAVTLLNQIEQAEASWTAAKKGKSRREYDSLPVYATNLRQYMSELESGKLTVKDFVAKMNQLSVSFQGTGSVIRANGENVKSFGDRVKELGSKFSAWFGVTRIIMRIYSTLRQMVSASIEVDNAMTQLQIVTKESDQVMSKFGDTAADAAKRIGSSVTDFLSSATTFARLGYSLNESSQLAEYTAMLQNVGNIDVAQAQDAITSIVKAYSDIDTNQIESVMDKLVSTGNGFPISVGQIAEGMTNASAALSAAGNSFDQSVALLTAANAATQNAAKASTGLRTIAARIRKTKTELDDLGETMETADYDKIVQQLTHFNVSLTDVNGEYRSTYDIMADIAAKWNDMTSMEQAALAEALSGNRQQQIFYSIINNFKEASGAMDAMSSSAGTLKNAYSTYMESTTAHINQFKASFQDLSSNLFKSDLLKFFIDLGTRIVNAMNGLQKVHILLPTIVAIATAIRGIGLAKRLAESTAKINVLTAATIKEKTVTESLKTSVAALTIKERERFAADIQSAVASGKLSDEEAKQILTTLGLATADGTLTVANKSLAGSFKTLMASIPVWGWIALGVSVLADAIIWLSSSVSSTSDNIRSLEESFAQTQNEMRQISDEFKNLKESADETIPRFSDLAKGVDDFGKNISLTDEEYKEFLSLNNKIAEMFPQLNMGMDENGNYMLALSYSADTLRESLEQLLEVQRQEANEALAKKMPQNINDVLGVAKEYSNQIKDIKSDIEVIQSGVFVKSVDTGDLNVLSNIQAKAEYDDFVEYLRKKGIEVEEIIDSTPGGTVYTAKWDKTSDASTNLVIGSLKKIDDLESRITSKWKTINPSINAWLQSDYLYNDMNSQMQQVAQTMANALDFNALGLVTDNGEDTADNIQTYITKYIINPLYSSSDEVKTAFKDSMSLFESGEISETEFADRMKVAFDKLKQGMDDNEVTEFTNAFVKGFNAIGIAGDDFDSVADAIVESWGKISKAGGDSDSSGGLSIQQYSEDIKKAQDAISPLLDAYNKLQKGEMSNNDIVTLIADKFPALIAYTNDLSAGVKQLASEELDKLKSKLNEIDKSQLSEDDLSAYETFIGYIDRLNDGFNSTLAYYEKIKSTTKSVSDSISTLIGLSKEIEANDGLSLSSVEKILSDETLTSLRPYLNDVKAMLPIINGLIEDQKQAYEDLYNEQQRLADPDAYIEASRQKQKEDENAFQNSIKRINEQIAKFKEKYGIDLSNWEQLSDGKKTVLQNTNAELLSKQSKLVNDFANYYNVDLKNFKDTTEAKAAILKNFRNSTALAQASQIAIEKGWLHNYQGNVLLDGEEARKEISSVLQPLGLTIDDFTHYLTNGSFTVATDERLTKQLNEILNAYTIAPTTWDDMTKNIGASGGSSGSSSKEKTWFEKQYAYHNHLVNMEQETEKSYLDWLDGAYKEAYRQGIIDLDAYYKYEEEVYKGRKKLTGDSVSWFEQQYKQHQHYLKMEQEDDADYLKWLNSAYQQAYKEGLLTLDEYRKYREEVYEGVKRLRDEAESAIKSLIDIRINMLKEDVNKEKEAIDKRLKNLKEFYDKQKELLQDKYDKEKYLDEQAEKRKKVSDVQAQIEALRMDDSAKAQKRRVELTKDLQEAQKDLTDFEKEHTFNEAKDQLDKLYENQEKVLNKQTEALDKKLSSPQELYEQALNDIRNGSQNLYGQMIEWNNLYGDGIRDTIKKAWEEAYKAEKQYFNYTGTHFNGVNLSNATGYVKGVSGYASGTSHAIAGIHKVDEQGVETIFQSADGQRYRMFSSGEKVLNASASDFLYKFANKGREILDKLFNGTSHSYNNVVPGVVANNIQLGDIVIQGNADKSTVSEIRRAQRENLEQMLKQLNRLK